LAESLVSATIAKWLKQPGDKVEQYEPICEVITDKVNAEIPSTVDGIMGEWVAEEGQTVAVGEVICRIAAAGTAGAPAEERPQAEPHTTPAPVQAEASGDQSMRGRYSPAVQSLAAEHGVNLSAVQGTGMGGRITRKDVLAYIEHGGGATETGRAAEAPAKREVHSPFEGLPHANPAVRPEQYIPNGRAETMIDVTPIRNAIATNMRQSVSEIPHAWTMIEVDVTNLVLLRNKLKDEFKRREGYNLTYLAFLLKAVVNAIKDYPIMNSVWAVNKIIVKRDINISLAVGTEDSVMTPRPVVINDMIAVRSMANICLSLDHRILDGVICGRFLQRVKENVEGYTLDTKVY
ncbi:hypothetical protein BGX30_005794, partial [Mortierella sp. GBA39]